MNKTQAVYNHLLTGASLTVKDSVERFNLYALSQTLGYLRRQKGIPVQSCLINLPNGKRFSSYWLERDYIAKVKAGEIENGMGRISCHALKSKQGI